MRKIHQESGFTAIELLITLFVAAAFLIAGYQLFNVVIKDGGQARAESRAGNVAYDYMRRYSLSATNPCSSQTLLSNSSTNIDGLSNAKITVVISCPEFTTTSLSKIDVTITFNTPLQTVKYSTFVNGTGVQSPDVTDGLISWWKFNGNANSSVGTMDGTTTNATLVQGQNGIENGAYSFNGSSTKIDFPLTGLPTTMSEVTVSVWANPTVSADSALFIAVTDDAANRFIVHMPYTGNLIYWDFGNNGAGGRLTGAFNVAWLNTWALYTYTASASGGMKVYRNGVSVLSSGTASTFTKGSKTLTVGFCPPCGGAKYWTGTMDDMRIYSRALSASEVLTLYNGGAK